MTLFSWLLALVIIKFVQSQGTIVGEGFGANTIIFSLKQKVIVTARYMQETLLKHVTYLTEHNDYIHTLLYIYISILNNFHYLLQTLAQPCSKLIHCFITLQINCSEKRYYLCGSVQSCSVQRCEI